MQPAQENRKQTRGIGQLTVVEHALCPLDPRRGLVENLVHTASYRFSDGKGKRHTAQARVFCPLGLTARDELYLWGLLALTMTHNAEDGELRATPHWCLRQLGMIDSKGRRGGRQYRQFADSLRRLSVVKYLSDNFYDPVRCEHRQVGFGFLSFSLPLDLGSGRAWRIAWDPVFFELISSAAGHLRFDLDCYRRLDPASRRLFLFASKVFARRSMLPVVNLRELAVNLLGFAPTLASRDMKVKVGRCIRVLQSSGVLGSAKIELISRGEYRVTLTRGDYFTGRPRPERPVDVSDGPLSDTLLGIGFDARAASRLLHRYPHRLLAEWADITLAAMGRFGPSFFRRSPMAYLVDSVSKAANGIRTPPDWWRELCHDESADRSAGEECKAVFDQIRRKLFDEPRGEPAASVSERHGFASTGSVIRDLK